MPWTIEVSAHPGFNLEDRTSKVYIPNAASFGMYPERAMPLVSVTIIVAVYGDSGAWHRRAPSLPDALQSAREHWISFTSKGAP